MKYQRTLYPLLMVLMLATQSAIIEQRVGNRSNALYSTLVTYITGGVVMTILIMITNAIGYAGPLRPPSKAMLPTLVLCGVIISFADFFQFQAFASGATVLTVTVIGVTLFPIFSVAISLMLGGVAPHPRQIVGFIMAIIAVFLVAK